MVINGETYRHGPQGSRDRGSSESYDLQKRATKSHIDFIKYIKLKYQTNCDIFLSYYTLKNEWDSDFENDYSVS